MLKSILLFLCLFYLPKSANAGLDSYTYLDKVENWTIERKVNSKDKSISCRASIPKNGTWFGARTRLNQSGEIVFPTQTVRKEIPSNETILSIKKALKICRAGFIYLPELFYE